MHEREEIVALPDLRRRRNRVTAARVLNMRGESHRPSDAVRKIDERAGEDEIGAAIVAHFFGRVRGESIRFDDAKVGHHPRRRFARNHAQRIAGGDFIGEHLRQRVAEPRGVGRVRAVDEGDGDDGGAVIGCDRECCAASAPDDDDRDCEDDCDGDEKDGQAGAPVLHGDFSD